MASRYEVEVTLTSAKDLKNINWRYGAIRPYAVVWVDQQRKVSTRADEEGDTCPYWNQTLVIPLDSPIEDSTLHIDVVHAKSPDEDIKPLIGTAKLPLRAVVDEAGLGSKIPRSLKLTRPSGRPHGKIEVEVSVRDTRYRAPDPYYAAPYGVRGGDYAAPPPAGYPYASAPPPAYRRMPEEPTARLRRLDTRTVRRRRLDTHTARRRSNRRLDTRTGSRGREVTVTDRRRRKVSLGGWGRDWRWGRWQELWEDWRWRRDLISWRITLLMRRRKGWRMIRLMMATSMAVMMTVVGDFGVFY